MFSEFREFMTRFRGKVSQPSLMVTAGGIQFGGLLVEVLHVDSQVLVAIDDRTWEMTQEEWEKAVQFLHRLAR